MKKYQLLLIGLILLCYITLQFGAKNEVASTLIAKPGGIKALFLLLAESGKQPKGWYFPFSSLVRVERNGTLFVISPQSLGGEEELLSWVAQGNRLIYFDSSTDSGEKLKKLLHLKEVEGRGETISDVVMKHKTISFSCPKTFNACQTVKQIVEPSQAFLGRTYSFRVPPGGEALVGDEVSAQALYLRHGAGEIWFFVGEQPIVNQQIDQVDNSELFFRLATEETQIKGGGKIYFDEFHHGYTMPQTVEAKRQNGVVYSFIGCLFLWLLLGAMSRMVRFGNAQASLEELPSATTDFVSALGLLYADRNTSSILVKYLHSWRMKVKKVLGISDKFTSGQLLDEMVYQGVIEKAELPQYKNAIDTLEMSANVSKRKVTKAIATLEQTLSS